MNKALITGITGQDGSYLTELLLSKGYEVHGLIRRASTFNTGRIDHLYMDPHERGVRLLLHYGDLSNSEQLTSLIYNIRPEEIYHLGAHAQAIVLRFISMFIDNVVVVLMLAPVVFHIRKLYDFEATGAY